MKYRHCAVSKITAFTLVELMVVVAVLALMVALMMPAIQASRESSRAINCRNNLKQIGTAIANYESVYKTLPKGAEGRFDRTLSPATMYGFSWWVLVLPFLEQDAIVSELDRTGANVGWAQANAHNASVANGFGPSFLFCPSSSVERFVAAGNSQIAAPSYCGISGASNEDGFDEWRVSKCCRSDGQISGGGVETPNAKIRVQQISDGLSSTLLVGEQSDYSYTQTRQVKRIGAAFANGWLTGTRALNAPPKYDDWLMPSYNLATIRYHLNERRYDLPGIYEDMGANNPLLSAHPGIVNLLYCDGSVHAMDDSLDIQILKSAATRDDGSSTEVIAE
jgi:prepilin-type processing-associated H-X9-DG protein